MEIWTMWTQFLQNALGMLSTTFGFSEAMSIILLTLIARFALFPLSLSTAYQSHLNKEKMERVKPKIEKLRKKLKDKPSELSRQTMALYKENGIKFFDKKTILNILSQSIFGIGLFKILKQTEFRSKFLWIADIGKPDIILTALVGVFMAISVFLMPDTFGQASTWIMIAIPVLISIIVVATLPSSIGIYWATSNVFSVGQAIALRVLISKRQFNNSRPTNRQSKR